MSEKLEAVFDYKDASRYFWRVTVWKSGECESWQGADSIDFVWSYKIERSFSGESNWQEIYGGEIQGQYEIFPDAEDIMLDFMNYTQSFVIGFCRERADEFLDKAADISKLVRGVNE